MKEEIYKCYPDAKRASLKTGGNFPYLSQADEVNLHLQVLTNVYLSGVPLESNIIAAATIMKFIPVNDTKGKVTVEVC